MSDFELLLRKLTIREWRDLDQIHPHDACFQQSHDNIHPFWSAHRESDWLVGRLETRNQTNSSFLPATNTPKHFSHAFTVKTSSCLCGLSEESTRSFSSLSANPFLMRPLIFYMPCLVRLSLIFFLNGTTNSTISFRTLWNTFGWRRPATHQSA